MRLINVDVIWFIIADRPRINVKHLDNMTIPMHISVFGKLILGYLLFTMPA